MFFDENYFQFSLTLKSFSDPILNSVSSWKQASAERYESEGRPAWKFFQNSVLPEDFGSSSHLCELSTIRQKVEIIKIKIDVFISVQNTGMISIFVLVHYYFITLTVNMLILFRSYVTWIILVQYQSVARITRDSAETCDFQARFYVVFQE